MPEDLGIFCMSALQGLGQVVNNRFPHGTMREIVMRLTGITQIHLAVQCQKQRLRSFLCQTELGSSRQDIRFQLQLLCR